MAFTSVIRSRVHCSNGTFSENAQYASLRVCATPGRRTTIAGSGDRLRRPANVNFFDDHGSANSSTVPIIPGAFGRALTRGSVAAATKGVTEVASPAAAGDECALAREPRSARHVTPPKTAATATASRKSRSDAAVDRLFFAPSFTPGIRGISVLKRSGVAVGL